MAGLPPFSEDSRKEDGESSFSRMAMNFLPPASAHTGCCFCFGKEYSPLGGHLGAILPASTLEFSLYLMIEARRTSSGDAV